MVIKVLIERCFNNGLEGLAEDKDGFLGVGTGHLIVLG